MSFIRNKTTEKGFTLDKAIQVGVDNPGVPWQRTSGIVAGDRESYEMFAPLFDEIIREYHGHRKTDFHSRDLDSRKIVGGKLSSTYVLSVRLHTRRSIQGYSLPAGCCRSERRDLEDLIRLIFKRLGGEWRQGEGPFGVFYIKYSTWISGFCWKRNLQSTIETIKIFRVYKCLRG